MNIPTKEISSKVIDDITNLQIGKVKRKKGFSDTDVDSFKGKVKMLYLFPKPIDQIQHIYPRFNTEYRQILS